MATIIELLPYLEHGYIVVGGCNGNETLTPEKPDGGLTIRHVEYRMESEWSKPRYYSIEDLRRLALIPSFYDEDGSLLNDDNRFNQSSWGISCFDGGHTFPITALAEIERFIESGHAHREPIF